MQCFTVIFYLSMLHIICKADEIDNNSKSPQLQLGERHNLPIFPKNMRFVVTPHTYVVHTDNPKLEILTKKPVMAKYVPKHKTVTVINTKPISRPPLMKHRTFTVKPLMMSRKYKNMESKNDKNLTDEHYLKSKRSVFVSKTKRRRHSLKGFETPTTKYDDLDSSEEREDINEFIFIKDATKQLPQQIFDIDYDLDTSTDVVDEQDLRAKRSVNVIEEENVGSTTSGYKYNGQDSGINSDLFFKNIHT